MAATRERRSNAGAKMSKLLDTEEEDEFYSTTYGGFNEEGDDNDYSSEASDHDDVDSDFSIDENDEIRSDEEDADQPQRKRKGIDTRAYKEPAVKKVKKDTKSDDTSGAPRVKKEKKKPRDNKPTIQIYHTAIDKKSLRRTTSEKSKQANLRELEREARNKMMKELAAKKNVTEVRRLTQEELLAEAKKTEEINLKSLETYQKMELEKKKARVTKTVYKGPIVRYQSVTMPLIEELPDNKEINVVGDGSEVIKKAPAIEGKCSRTFITFTDEKVFNEHFSRKKTRIPVKNYCPVTRLPAKYFDPITQTPFSNVQAFKVIRDTYIQQMEQQSEKKAQEQSQTRRIRQQPVTVAAQ